MVKVLSRRTFLHGLGTVSIGLPFLEEMMPRAPRAQADSPPTRLITMFFGLGLAREQMLDGFDGPLEPYAPLQDKMAIFTNLELKHAHDFGSGEPHHKIGDVVFVGDPQRQEYLASGPSMEQLAKQRLHPDGVPTRLGSKSIGMWFRTGSAAQYTRHWNFDGSPGERPERRPSRIFEQFFGTAIESAETPSADEPTDPALVRARHLDRSVLDAVMDDYSYYTGERSPLGTASKAKLSVHLDNIRSIEQRVAPVESAIEDAVSQELCNIPAGVTDPGNNLPYELEQAGTGSGAPAIPHEDFAAAFQLQSELMALALRCDVVRFGSMLFVGAGGHVSYRGTYRALGSSIDFSADLPGTTPHDLYFHNNQWEKARLTQHLAQANIAYALSALDDPNYLEANGKTVLDNTLVVVGTDYGGGGNSTGHIPEGVFHAVAGGNGHFRPGFYDRVYNIIDLYETVLRPYGIESGMGAGNHPTFRYTPRLIDELLA